MAQSKPERAPDAYIEATEQRFFPILCKEGLKGLMNEVYDCYQHTKDNDPKYLQCMIADAFVFSITSKVNKKAEDLGQPIPFDAPFFTQEKWTNRIRKLLTLPQLSGYPSNERTPYLVKSTNEFIHASDAMNADPKNSCITKTKPVQ